jgi:hypothetical protein
MNVSKVDMWRGIGLQRSTLRDMLDSSWVGDEMRLERCEEFGKTRVCGGPCLIVNVVVSGSLWMIDGWMGAEREEI